MSRTRALLAAPFLLSAACASDPSADGTPARTFTVRAGAFQVAPATESYQCFTKTLDRDVWVDRISHRGQANVHHMVLVRTLAPEPDAPFECDTFFKSTWIPLFATGTADAALEVPAGSSFALPKGTQLLVQLHLMNTSDAPAEGSLDVELREVARTESEAGIFGFGTTLIDLPPQQVSSVTNDCAVDEDVEIFAVFPHMHTLGSSLSFSVGKDEASLDEVYRIDDWEFSEQFIAPRPLSLRVGDLTRTTCTYDNTRSDRVTFGESTENEMCFFTAFRTGYRGLAGCLELGGWRSQTPGGGDGGADAAVSPGGDGAACAAVTGNERGIGAPCTKGGGECGSGLSCTVDMSPDATQAFCMQVGGCAASAECGSDATCCAPAEGGGAIKICVPDACRPSDCAPVD